MQLNAVIIYSLNYHLHI